MKFKYHKVLLPQRSELFGTSILKPIIPIVLVFGENKARYAALIDSGADFSIIHAEVGEHLGVSVWNGVRHEFRGIQTHGPAEAFVHSVTLEIGGVQYKTDVGFSYDIAPQGFGILGQKGFFDIFIVKFDFVKEEIELKERK